MKNVVLIFGGKSFEHDISIITALIVLKKTKESKYNLLPVYIDKNDEWFYFAGKDLTASNFKDFANTYKKDGFKKVYLKDGGLHYKKGILETKIAVDAALNCCHGGMGEDGRLNAIFEQSGIPITSGNMVAMGVCMDKVLSKKFFIGCGVPVIDYFDFTALDYKLYKDKVYENAEKLGFPLILKPCSLGSSIGIKVVHDKAELHEAIKVALEFDNHILVEKAVLDGMKEYNIALIRKDGKIITSQIDEAIRSEEILSFKDKYIGDGTSQKVQGKGSASVPVKGGQKSGGYLGSEEKKWAEVPSKVKKEITQISRKIYEDLGLQGVVRFDFILNKKNKVFLNEINTVPGSLGYYFFVPQVFKTFSSFIDSLIDEAILINKNKAEIKKEFITNII